MPSVVFDNEVIPVDIVSVVFDNESTDFALPWRIGQIIKPDETLVKNSTTEKAHAHTTSAYDLSYNLAQLHKEHVDKLPSFVPLDDTVLTPQQEEENQVYDKAIADHNLAEKGFSNAHSALTSSELANVHAYDARPHLKTPEMRMKYLGGAHRDAGMKSQIARDIHKSMTEHPLFGSLHAQAAGMWHESGLNHISNHTRIMRSGGTVGNPPRVKDNWEPPPEGDSPTSDFETLPSLDLEEWVDFAVSSKPIKEDMDSIHTKEPTNDNYNSNREAYLESDPRKHNPVFKRNVDKVAHAMSTVRGWMQNPNLDAELRAQGKLPANAGSLRNTAAIQEHNEKLMQLTMGNHARTVQHAFHLAYPNEPYPSSAPEAISAHYNSLHNEYDKANGQSPRPVESSEIIAPEHQPIASPVARQIMQAMPDRANQIAETLTKAGKALKASSDHPTPLSQESMGRLKPFLGKGNHFQVGQHLYEPRVLGHIVGGDLSAEARKNPHMAFLRISRPELEIDKKAQELQDKMNRITEDVQKKGLTGKDFVKALDNHPEYSKLEAELKSLANKRREIMHDAPSGLQVPWKDMPTFVKNHHIAPTKTMHRGTASFSTGASFSIEELMDGEVVDFENPEERIKHLLDQGYSPEGVHIVLGESGAPTTTRQIRDVLRSMGPRPRQKYEKVGGFRMPPYVVQNMDNLTHSPSTTPTIGSEPGVEKTMDDLAVQHFRDNLRREVLLRHLPDQASDDPNALPSKEVLSSSLSGDQMRNQMNTIEQRLRDHPNSGIMSPIHLNNYINHATKKFVKSYQPTIRDNFNKVMRSIASKVGNEIGGLAPNPRQTDKSYQADRDRGGFGNEKVGSIYGNSATTPTKAISKPIPSLKKLISSLAVMPDEVSAAAVHTPPVVPKGLPNRGKIKTLEDRETHANKIAAKEDIERKWLSENRSKDFSIGTLDHELTSRIRLGNSSIQQRRTQRHLRNG